MPELSGRGDDGLEPGGVVPGGGVAVAAVVVDECASAVVLPRPSRGDHRRHVIFQGTGLVGGRSVNDEHACMAGGRGQPMSMVCRSQIPEVLLIAGTKGAQRAVQALAVGVKQECRRVFRDIHRANIQSCIHLLKQVGDGIRMFLAVGADDHEQRSCGIVHDRGLILRQHRIRSLAHLEVIHFPFHSSGHQPLGRPPGHTAEGRWQMPYWLVEPSAASHRS